MANSFVQYFIAVGFWIGVAWLGSTKGKNKDEHEDVFILI